MGKGKSGNENGKKRKRIEFTYEAPDAREVILVGSFNNWSPEKHPMKMNGDGIWRKTLILPQGPYEYKFLVDGQWKEDPLNERCCYNCFGSINSIVHNY